MEKPCNPAESMLNYKCCEKTRMSLSLAVPNLKTGGLREEIKTYGRLKPNGGKKHERYFNETAFGSRCSLWTSDKKMEP